MGRGPGVADSELGGFGGIVGAAEAEGGHELYEGGEGGHGGRRTRGQTRARGSRLGTTLDNWGMSGEIIMEAALETSREKVVAMSAQEEILEMSWNRAGDGRRYKMKMPDNRSSLPPTLRANRCPIAPSTRQSFRSDKFSNDQSTPCATYASLRQHTRRHPPLRVRHAPTRATYALHGASTQHAHSAPQASQPPYPHYIRLLSVTNRPF